MAARTITRAWHRQPKRADRKRESLAAAAAASDGFAGPAIVGRYLLIHAGATTLVAGACIPIAMGVLSPVYAASVILTVCVGWILYSWARVARTIVSPFWLFVLVASLFNGGHAFLQVLGLNKNGVMDSTFSEATTATTLMYVSISMMLLHLGALWRVARRSEPSAEPASPGLDKSAIRLGLLLVAIAIVPTVLQIREDLASVFTSGYGGLYQREALTNVGAWQGILALFMLPGALLVTAAARRRRTLERFALGIVLVYVISHIFMGYRGAAGAALAAYGWLRHTRVAKLPIYPSLAAAAIFVFIVFPMVRIHRSTIGEDRLSWSGFVQTLENYDNPAVASVSEMGGSMTTIAHTMDLMPSTRTFEYGASYFFAALTVAPNIFGTPLHPSIERGTASDWLIRTVSYRTAASGGGMGYSFIAEAYLNFGWMGPPLVMFLLGFGLASLEIFAARSASPAAAALLSVTLYFMLIYARAETSNIVRGIVWCGFVPLGLLWLFSGRKKQVKRRSIAPLPVGSHRRPFPVSD